INDLYETVPTQGGTRGGLARVAELRRKLLARNPNTFMILAGDFLSPSALSTAKVDGRELKGRHMIATLDTAGLDLAVFGNHEFDLKQNELDERIREGREKFLWLSGNVRDLHDKPFAGLPETHVQEFRSPTGHLLRVGFLTTMTSMNQPPYVKYSEPLAYAKEMAKRLRPQVDILVAITHMGIADDIHLAEQAPEVDLILGGHDHESLLLKRGARLIPIAKADSNAKTAYVHLLKFNPSTKRIVIDSALHRMDESLAQDPETQRVAETWVQAAFDGFRRDGFRPERVVAHARETLHASEAQVRHHPTNLTREIGLALLREFNKADVAVFTGGGIRLDDSIPPGPITEYDVIRILPFPDTVVGYEIKGSELQRLLNDRRTKAGTGDFLQTSGITALGTSYLMNLQPLEADRTYRVATNTFLGNTLKSEYGAKQIYKGDEVRRALIKHLKAVMP
ncbi:MAG: bifunctional metallophosphatase/5'-nucleotidase, partial [Bdellovibrionaceae bacterium]|nr:bifunctional metallophosphatase/5'-nucleotidase [Pseudobdellovibrionaceae bacterium]